MGKALKEKVIRNTTISGAAHVILSIIRLLLLPFMVGYLGTTEYGLIGFAKAFSILGIMRVLDSGLRLAVSRFVAQYKTQNNREVMREYFAGIGRKARHNKCVFVQIFNKTVSEKQILDRRM